MRSSTGGSTSSGLPSTRRISTTAPLAGGGDLSADRTLTIATMGASGAGHARGVVPDPPAVAGTAKFLREDATWAIPGGGGGGSLSNGSATLNFGAAPGGVVARVSVAAPGIVAGNLALAALMYEASADHTAEEHALVASLVSLTAYASAPDVLTVEARSFVRLTGRLAVRWAWSA